MRPKTFTVDGTAGGASHSPIFIVDRWIAPCNIGIGVVVSGANTLADIQHTFADPFAVDLTTTSAAAWLNNSTLVSANATNQNGMVDINYASPPTAIRMRVRALISAGTGTERATVTFVQAGSNA